MDASVHNTLLALLFVIKDLNRPLNPTEKEILFNISQQVLGEVDSDVRNYVWENSTKPSILKILQGDDALYQRFEGIKSSLDRLGNRIYQELLPSYEELEKVVPRLRNKPKSFLAPIDEESFSDSDNYEISNMVFDFVGRVLETPDPDRTVNKFVNFDLDKLGKTMNFSVITF